MSKIKVALKNKKTGKETIIGDDYLAVVAPYGLSPTHSSIEEELYKIDIAETFKADMVKDNTIGRREWFELIKRVRDHTDLCVGASVTITAANIAYSRNEKHRENPKEGDFYKAFEILSEYCDSIEVFPTVTLESLEMVNRSQRIMKNSVSRAGNIITRYINLVNKENPFYQNFDWFLDEAAKNKITLILGNGFRAGCLEDSLDDMQMYEIRLMKKFSDRAHEKGVDVIAGVYGHVKYDKNKLESIRKVLDIPTGGLCPLLTDVGCGYDHINAAIGIFLLRDYIDWVSLITPTEHIGLPTLKDYQEGMATISLARHILDLTRNKKGFENDKNISKARNNLDWESMKKYSINQYNPRWDGIELKLGHNCSLCGPYCPLIKNENEERK